MHVNPMGQYWRLTMPHTCILLFLHGHANPGTKSHVGKSTWRQDLVPHRWAVLCLTDDGVDTQSFTWTSPIKWDMAFASMANARSPGLEQCEHSFLLKLFDIGAGIRGQWGQVSLHFYDLLIGIWIFTIEMCLAKLFCPHTLEYLPALLVEHWQLGIEPEI